jgi:uncharacterized membrane protein
VAVAWLCVKGLHVTGVYSSLLRDLWYAPGLGRLDFVGLAAGAVALAGAGIIADLAVAVTATIQEVHKAGPHLPARDLIRSGMRFGRDVIGTEINTLPFALLGCGLGGILLVLVRPDVANWPYSWMSFSNRQSLAVEVSAMTAGTTGLALTIPLTAFLVGMRLGRAGPVRQPLPTVSPSGDTHRRAASMVLLVAASAGAIVVSRGVGGTSYQYPSGRGQTQTRLIRATVVSVCSPVPPESARDGGRRSEFVQTVDVRTADGTAYSVENAITGSPVNDLVVTAGDRVVIRVQESNGHVYASMTDIERDRGAVVLALIVCVAVVTVSGWSGWRALAALAASLGILTVFLLVIVRLRAPPLPWTLGSALAVAGVTFLILCGPRRKAAGACLGVALGMAVASVAGIGFGKWLGLSGRYDSDLMALVYYSSAEAFDFPALLGAAGVAMDVAISVASAVEEVRSADPACGFRSLFGAGLAVGRKVIVAMFGAIFFASIGLNLGLFLLPWSAPGALGQALGNERVVTEAYRLLVAGLALTWCVPGAALCSAWLASRRSCGPCTETVTRC